MDTFGSRLKKARKYKKLTQRQLGKLIGSSFASISEWEHNHHRPDLNIVEELCRALEVDASWLLQSEDTNKTQNKDIELYMKGELSELSDEAKKELEIFIEYLKVKYKK